MIQGSDLPTLNAMFNATSAILLLFAFWAVKARKFVLHRNLMYAALACSAAFLTSYLIYHFGVHRTKSYGGPYRPFYLVILISHTVLATLVLPLVLATVGRALRGQRDDPRLMASGVTERFARHRSIARWTFPIWLYVSVTGVVIYWMLYQMVW